MIDFSRFDSRHYRTLPVRDGYDAWAPVYDQTVADEMDIRLLERSHSIDWAQVNAAMDLACGTGRIGAWLRGKGVQQIHGVGVSEKMLRRAAERCVYNGLARVDLASAHFDRQFDLVIEVLADEHLSDFESFTWPQAERSGAGVM